MKIESLKICIENRMDIYAEMKRNNSKTLYTDKWVELVEVESHLVDLFCLLITGVTCDHGVVCGDDKATQTFESIVYKWCDRFDEVCSQLDVN